MFDNQTLLYAVYLLAAAAAILAIEAAYIQLSRSRAKSGTINRRLKMLAEDAPAQTTLKNLLRERGLSETGDFSFRNIALNRLFTQSGVTGNPFLFWAVFVMSALFLGVAARIFVGSYLYAAIIFLIMATLMPYMFLRTMRLRRIDRFERQLPDALDMITRSLRAGHPTNAAVSLVAREMPDPLGTEFGIVADEITFGLNIEQAFRRLSERVGSDGMKLLSVAISIQSRTGGNLTEILLNLSKVIRERGKLRLKIRALSSEGRLSAWLISFFPIFMFGILWLIAPSYYGRVWDDPLMIPTLTAFAIWALIGDFIMYRMVNFDF